MVGGPRTPHRASQLPVSGLRRPEQTPSQDGQPDPPPPPWPGPPNPASVLTQHRSPSPFPSNPKLTQGSLGPSSRPWCSADPEQQAWPWGRRREGTRPPPALTTRAASAGQVCRQVSLPEPPLRRGARALGSLICVTVTVSHTDSGHGLGSNPAPPTPAVRAEVTVELACGRPAVRQPCTIINV